MSTVTTARTLETFLKSRAATRLIPVLFFNLLSLGVFLVVYPPTSKADLKLVIFSVLSFARGYPSYNWLMWFLVCLFVVEILHFFLGKYATTTLRLAALAVGVYLVGWVLLWQSCVYLPRRQVSRGISGSSTRR